MFCGSNSIENFSLDGDRKEKTSLISNTLDLGRRNHNKESVRDLDDLKILYVFHRYPCSCNNIL